MQRAQNILTVASPGRRTLLKAAGVAATGTLFGRRVLAQDNVTRIVVPFPAGNPIDAIARVLAEALRQSTGRNYIVDNKAGAAGIIGTSEVARSRPDGSTMLFTTGGHNTNAVLYSKLPYDVSRDFTPITQLLVSPGFVLLTRADSRFKTLADVLAEAKAKPGTVSYASWGPGNTTHLVGALFARAARVDLMHVPYKGSPFPDLLGGHVDLTWFGTSPSMQLIQEGKVRALAISWPQRIPELPNVPSVAEFGFKDVDIPSWGGLFGPAGMPAALVQSIHADVVAASRRPEYVAAMKTMGATITNMAPQQFAELNAEELRRHRKDIGPLAIKLD
ncbi:Bug family tripartite tricarboxylate transporter substrate binding protein [Ramlibacter albus]|uniref:Tripartite tricarboxylate transporter substrate binding protein n=1 Tax=Ramlibacter albus TaxID=2079448 RepID=A0A923MEQ5_9BURK|nr:tripartite tricarboxylate transporter substrate binding protein [Ramlibacter albus]MBC5768221.1 tripartite tricarboxylate transporter substrate binding protein [Ramlibacter albus]